MGEHIVQIDVYSDTVPAAPILRLPDIHLEILPCYVRDVILGNEDSSLGDFDLKLGDRKEFPFEQFTQVPACNYYTNYTVTLIESPGRSVSFNEAIEGDSKFSSLDLD